MVHTAQLSVAIVEETLRVGNKLPTLRGCPEADYGIDAIGFAVDDDDDAWAAFVHGGSVKSNVF
jgi:hypothetical protein